MKIALVGYGKMGHAIERIALERGHEVVCTIDSGEDRKYHSPEFKCADLVIEFSRPDAAVDNYRRIIAAGLPLVSGTTGWTAAMPEVKELLAGKGTAMFWTSNFSIGVNLFRKVNSYLARLMQDFAQYAPAMTEVHHVHKRDHPSGTAISLADDIIAAGERVASWTEDPQLAATDPSAILISHIRWDEAPGTHIVNWTSPVDNIRIEHRAFSRDGFALGAVLAAEWLHAHPETRGLVGMDSLLGNL